MGSSDIWTVSISTDGSVLQVGNPKPLVETPADENQAAFSRDVRWVAYASAGQTGPEIYVRAWPDDGRSWQISNRGGSQPLFSRSRDELYFVNPDQQLMAVPTVRPAVLWWQSGPGYGRNAGSPNWAQPFGVMTRCPVGKAWWL